ncbi:MAG: preprotein translocase subunit YajC [Lachnospiraceae bacterium]|nr:preprotein translocase subunit YajC [Lachnospiraceae bacterium]
MSGTIQIIALYAAVIGVMWFFLMRPQRKKQKEHDSLVATVEAGDSILTNSGFYGVVIDVSDEVVIVEFGNNKNCRIPMKKDAIAEIEKVEEK